MTPDIDVFTPEVLATLVTNVKGNIITTDDTCTLLSDSDDPYTCGDCPFNYTIIGCIDKHYQILLAEHFPELFI